MESVIVASVPSRARSLLKSPFVFSFPFLFPFPALQSLAAAAILKTSGFESRSRSEGLRMTSSSSKPKVPEEEEDESSNPAGGQSSFTNKFVSEFPESESVADESASGKLVEKRFSPPSSKDDDDISAMEKGKIAVAKTKVLMMTLAKNGTIVCKDIGKERLQRKEKEKRKKKKRQKTK